MVYLPGDYWVEFRGDGRLACRRMGCKGESAENAGQEVAGMLSVTVYKMYLKCQLRLTLLTCSTLSSDEF